MGFVPHHSYANLIDLVHAYNNARKVRFLSVLLADAASYELWQKARSLNINSIPFGVRYSPGFQKCPLNLMAQCFNL